MSESKSSQQGKNQKDKYVNWNVQQQFHVNLKQ